MSMNYDVLIIGCGITGAAAAFELSKYQLKVGILERENDVATGTTRANSAILHAGYDPKPGTLMAKLNVRGSALAQTLCKALAVPYQPCGSLVLAFSEEENAIVERLYRQGIENGVPHLTILTGEQARTMEPNLSDRVTAALHAPTAALCLPWTYCLALAETAVRNGVQLHLNTAVTGLEQTGDGWLVHTAQGDAVKARYILNAAGVDAQTVHALAAPHTFTIHPVRGQYDLLDKSEGGRVGRIIFQCPNAMGKGVLVAPTVHGNLIVGPDAIPVSGCDVSVTAEGLDAVRKAAAQSVPSLAFRQSIRNFAGVRAVADTGDFVLEEAAPHFIDLAGICSPGLSAAPAIAEYAVELLKRAGLSLKQKTSFLSSRSHICFHQRSAGERAALVAQNPAYGRVVCRCETVTEGEILDALHSVIPPQSVDGVKRRVNTGMGRCQGGFCSPRVVELLAKAWQQSPQEILQDRAGTWLLACETKGRDTSCTT